MVLPLSLGLPPPRPHRWLEARRLCAPTVKRGARLPLWVDAVEKGILREWQAASIQDQMQMRNLDSKIRPPGFDRFKF